MSDVSVLTSSLDLSPPISMGFVYVHLFCATASMWSGRSPMGIACLGSGLPHCAVPLTLVWAEASAAQNNTAAATMKNRRIGIFLLREISAGPSLGPVGFPERNLLFLKMSRSLPRGV